MEKVVFTNGCFDLIHPGHIDLLKKARALGTKLIVGLNSDRSVRTLKGSARPFLDQAARAGILRELRPVDEVRIFDENTPEKLIRSIKPDVLVKGGDWTTDEIVGADFVLKNGGKVFSIPFVEDFSTSKIAERIKSSQESGWLEDAEKNDETDHIENFLKTNLKVFEKLLNNEIKNLSQSGEIIVKTLQQGNKIFFAGGAASLEVVRYLIARFDRRLNGNANLLKLLAPASDFSDQIKAEARPGDLLLVLTAAGQPEALISAVMEARRAGCRTLALNGSGSVKIASLCDASVTVFDENEAIVSSVQLAVGTLWSGLIKKK